MTMTQSPVTFTCPVCGATSHHPQDAQYGYCGGCHDHTGECRYFALCDNAAEGYVEHPQLGKVPACRRCTDHLGVELATVPALVAGPGSAVRA